MKFFVTGVGGQLGHDVMNELLKRGHEGVGSDIQENYSGVADDSAVTKAPYVALDITDKEAVEKVITEVNPDAVIHCAAWTAVDMAEDDDKSTATELSGGQSQRLALARNFYRDAPIVILDEPTSAIDALAESRIFDRLFHQADKTFIIVSHRLTTIRKADIIYVIEQGKVVEQGVHAELVAKKGHYYRMFESQITK